MAVVELIVCVLEIPMLVPFDSFSWKFWDTFSFSVSFFDRIALYAPSSFLPALLSHVVISFLRIRRDLSPQFRFVIPSLHLHAFPLPVFYLGF